MLFLLPVQITWAGVSAYCKHESGATAQHFGHHEHQHQSQEEDGKKDSPSFKFDGDCGFCQFGGIGFTSISSVSIGTLQPQVELNWMSTDLLSSYRPDRPERPKWVRAA
ncbi:cobalt-zinc-cadmium resistance protein [Oxalobacteraceae bacterium R-40]|uniref:Cobalt-zinc-cadmium resistance protein n=2 Tax=Keguizhuia sedimenti TaxID=3064264 RepID=A0ABU1BWB8_9BURK|nr:cobalt-zinc-cadmium resistance protein [Oxalobacteraceae bacterium R-40]